MDAPLQNRQQLLAALRRVLIEQLKLRIEPAQVQPDTPLFGTGLGLDSVDAVDLVVGLEKETGIRVPEDARGRAGLRTVNTLLTLLMELEREGRGEALQTPGIVQTPELPPGYRALRQGVALSRSDQVTIVRVSGEEAFDLVDAISPRPLFVRDGQILPTLLLDADGGVLADLSVAVDDLDYLLLAEGVDAQQLGALLEAHAEGLDATWRDERPAWTLLSLDGPFAWELLAELVGPEVVGVPYLTLFLVDELGGICLRSGKTGEFGYDLLIPTEREQEAWDRLLELGQDLDIVEARQDERDLCALENGFFCVRHQGMVGREPGELQLLWRIELGRDVPGLRGVQPEPRHRLCWLSLSAPMEPGQALHDDGVVLGEILEVRRSPLLGELALASLLSEAAWPEQPLDEGRVVSPPMFYNRSLRVDVQKHSYAGAEADLGPLLAQP
jgi:acyl carrier protein